MLGIWGVTLLLLLFSTYLTLEHFKRTPAHLDAPFALFPVSILKPLKGSDSGLAENLESFFRLDYPEFELLFSVADAYDPAGRIVMDLMERYPTVNAELVVGAVDVGTNPKINNLIRTYDRATHDWILISDSNVRVDPDYLKRLVAEIENCTGIVTSVVAGRSPEGLGGQLEATYLNTFYARAMLLASSAGHPCVIGKSMLFRKSAAERFGGLKNLSRYLAEDYMAGQAMLKLDLRTVTATDPIDQHIGSYSFREFWSRHLRWGRIRKAQAPVAFLAEPLMSSIFSGFLGAVAFQQEFGISALAFFALHLMLCFVCDLLTMRALEVEWTLKTPVYWMIREALSLPLWFHTLIGNTVIWRGKSYGVLAGGLLAQAKGTFPESESSHA